MIRSGKGSGRPRPDEASGGGYVVRWSQRALEDLTVAVKTADVAHRIIDVAELALVAELDPGDPDGGRGRPPVLWRRALSTTDRERLSTLERQGLDIEDSAERSWHYLIVYRPLQWQQRLRPNRREAFLVLAVVRDRAVFGAWLQGGHSTG